MGMGEWTPFEKAKGTGTSAKQELLLGQFNSWELFCFVSICVFGWLGLLPLVGLCFCMHMLSSHDPPLPFPPPSDSDQQLLELLRKGVVRHPPLLVRAQQLCEVYVYARTRMVRI